MKIYCIGEILIDLIGEEDAGLRDNQEFSKRPGGAPANVAVAASRLGADVEMVATVGKYEFGDYLGQKMKGENIGVSNLRKTDQYKTTLAFAALNEDAKPEFSFYRGADQKIIRDQLRFKPGSEDIVHIGSLPFTDNDTAEVLLDFLDSIDTTVSFDPNLRQDLLNTRYEETLRDVIGYVDVLTAADEELEFFGGLEELREKVEEIIVTRGAEGAEIFTEKDSYFVGSKDVEVIDTTGAGDALTGAYLAFRHHGREQALQKAVKAASISTTSKGAMSALPEIEELE